MKAIKTIIILLILFFGSYIFLRYKTDTTIKSNKKPTIALSTFVLLDVAKAISANTLNCFMIVPIGVDIEEFEPTPRMMARLLGAKLIVYSGAGLEPWMTSFVNSKNALNMGKYIKLRYVKSTHFGKVADPHYWLNIKNMIIVAKVLRDKFKKMFPKNKALYEANTAIFIKHLKRIDYAYKTQLKSCKKHTIIVGHNAFSYLAHEYHFKVDSISGLAPDAQPDARTIKRIITDVKDNNISTIFFIPFTNTSIMKSIARETGTKVGILEPIVNITKKKLREHATYFSLMMSNLNKISHALKCR